MTADETETSSIAKPEALRLHLSAAPLRHSGDRQSPHDREHLDDPIPGRGSRALMPANAARPLPIFVRPFDLALIGFFLFNFVVITYVVDIEQITAPVNPDPGEGGAGCRDGPMGGLGRASVLKAQIRAFKCRFPALAINRRRHAV